MRAHRLALRGAERPLFKDILNARPPPPELVRLTAGRDVVVVVGVAARSCEEFGCRFTGVRTGIGVWERERDVGVDGRRSCMVYNDGLAEGSAEDVGNSIFVSSGKSQDSDSPTRSSGLTICEAGSGRHLDIRGDAATPVYEPIAAEAQMPTAPFSHASSEHEWAMISHGFGPGSTSESHENQDGE